MQPLRPRKAETKTLIAQWKFSPAENVKYKAMTTFHDPKIIIDKSKDYDFDEMASMVLASVKDENNKTFFEGAVIKLGDYSGQYMCSGSFKNEKGQVCSFWEYAPLITGKNSQMRLYLYVQKICEKNICAVEDSLKEKNSKQAKAVNEKKIEPLRPPKQFTEYKKNESKVESIGSISNLFHKDAAPVIKNRTSIENFAALVRNKSFKSNNFVSNSSGLESKSFVKTPLDNIANLIKSKSEKNSKSVSHQSHIQVQSEKKRKLEESALCQQILPSSKKLKSTADKCFNSSNESLASDKHMFKPGKIFNPGKYSEEDDLDYYSSGNLEELGLSVPVIKPANIKIEIDFTDSKVLGKGGFGKVVTAVWRKTKVAVKMMKLTVRKINVYREISVMERLRHPGIINIMAVAKFQYWYLVLEFFESSNLHEILFEDNVKEKYNLTLKEKTSIALQLTNIVAFLHESEVFHKDLKPSNVLVNLNSVVKVCDFGLSRFKTMPSELVTTDGGHCKGTYMYMAPETLENKCTQSPGDVWSLSCIVVELYNEKSAWSLRDLDLSVSFLQGIRKLVFAKGNPEYGRVPLKLHSALNKCFKLKPSERANINVLHSALKEISAE